jgi:hypothetical protein
VRKEGEVGERSGTKGVSLAATCLSRRPSPYSYKRGEKGKCKPGGDEVLEQRGRGAKPGRRRETRRVAGVKAREKE